MSQPLKVLLAEDSAIDAELLLRQLRRSGFAPEVGRAVTEAEFLAGLQACPDIILSDYNMGGFDGLRALELAREHAPGVPLIIVSGAIGEDLAVGAIKRGAADYLMKDRLARLGSAITHALAERDARVAREQSALAVRESERFVRAALDGLSAHIAILDEGGIILAVNRAWRVFAANNGLPANQGMEGSNYLAVCEAVRGDGKVAAGQIATAIREILAGRPAPFELEYPCHGGGELRWFVARVTALAGSGPRRAIIAHENVTARKGQEDALRASEERFRQIAENIHEVVWMSDPDRHAILYVSPAYEKIWGRSCAELLAHPESWLDTLHAEDRARVAAALKGQSLGTYEETYRVVRPDGSLRWVRDRAFPIRDEQGRVYRIVGTAEDITENRDLQEQFIQAQKMEAIGTLAGGIAHDFNNILAAILGYTELLRLLLKDRPQVAGHLTAMFQASARGVALVRQILTFSRRGEHFRKPLTLTAVVAEPLDLLRVTIPVNIGFDVVLDDKVPPVLADPTQIHQLVMNLCTNAAHAMKDRPGRLGVRVEACELTAASAKEIGRLKPGPYVRLTVSDTGRGMTSEVMARIFEPFFTTKGPGEGTGLGLSVVHGIMEAHEGAVRVRSVPEEGTTFDLYFPAYVLPLAEAGPTVEAEPPRGQGERILFVDDEPPLMLVGRLILEELGYRVDGMTDVVEALGIVRAEPGLFDLVVTDNSMPGMSGLEFARRLREIRPALPIILTTGLNPALTTERLAQLGVRELLLKPFSMEKLASAAHRVLARAKASPET